MAYVKTVLVTCMLSPDHGFLEHGVLWAPC